jgi:hypothetical protein
LEQETRKSKRARKREFSGHHRVLWHANAVASKSWKVVQDHKAGRLYRRMHGHVNPIYALEGIQDKNLAMVS